MADLYSEKTLGGPGPPKAVVLVYDCTNHMAGPPIKGSMGENTPSHTHTYW